RRETMAQKPQAEKWWQGVPGIITALAALITAVTGLLIGLRQLGYFQTTSSQEGKDIPPIAEPKAPASTPKPPNGDGEPVRGVPLPPVEGKPLSTAMAELLSAGLKADIRRIESEGPKESVVEQNPKGGSTVEPNSVVVLTIPDSVVTVPNVV